MEKKILRTQSKACDYMRSAAEILKNFTEKLVLNGVTRRNFQLKLEKQKKHPKKSFCILKHFLLYGSF